MTRLWLVLLCLALLALVLLGMRVGWRNRMRSQVALPPLPDVPHSLGDPVLPPLTGLYVGTTFAKSWQDRVIHEGLGLRAVATIALHRDGVLIDRDGARAIFLPAASLSGARLAPGLAGKVIGAGGLLVISWKYGADAVDTGFRADDKTSYAEWVRAINGKVAA